MWNSYNSNPEGNKVGDCVVRAIGTALGLGWDDAYIGLCLQGFVMADMPSSNAVWSRYLRKNGYDRHVIPNECPDCYTVEDFCRDNPSGSFVLGTGSHAVAVLDGDYYDAWDSGAEIPLYYFAKRKGES